MGWPTAWIWWWRRRGCSPRVASGRLRPLLVGEGAEAAPCRPRAASALPNLSFLPPMPGPELARLFAGSQIGLHCLAPVPEFAEMTATTEAMDYLAAGLPVVSPTAGALARLACWPAAGRHRHSRPVMPPPWPTRWQRWPPSRCGGSRWAVPPGVWRWRGWIAQRQAARFVALAEAAFARPLPPRRGTGRMSAPLVLMLSNAHPPGDVGATQEGAALAAAGWRVLHLCPAEGRRRRRVPSASPPSAAAAACRADFSPCPACAGAPTACGRR